MTAGRKRRCGPQLKAPKAASYVLRHLFNKSDALDLSMRELSQRSGYAYDYLRKVRNGTIVAVRIQVAEDLAAVVGVELPGK